MTAVRTLNDCRSWENYQAMGTAHLNIITTPKDIELAVHLEEKLGIPWVCLGGIYSTADLTSAYAKLGELLGHTIDLSEQSDALSRQLEQTKAMIEGKTITVEDDGELAKWLFTEGFPVTTVKLNPHQGITKELRLWLEEQGIKVEGAMRGPGGKGGRPGGKPGGRPGGRPEPMQVGYAGAMAALNNLKRSAGGDAR